MYHLYDMGILHYDLNIKKILVKIIEKKIKNKVV